MKNKSLLILAGVLVAQSGLAQSDPENAPVQSFSPNRADPSHPDGSHLDTLVVTADRQQQTLGEAIPNTTVVSREQIEASAALDVMELLRLQPGIDIARSGGIGQQTSVFVRGTNSNQVLVLIDGVRTASVHTGAYAWENLPLAQIERIEIVRGPRASLYGSDAIGGVIQIFTRRPSGPQVKVSGGSFSSVAGEAAVGHNGPTFSAGAAVGYYDSDGFSAQNPNGFSYDPDDDGYRNKSFSGGVNGDLWGDLGASHRWFANAYYSDGQTEFDQGESSSTNQIVGLGVDGQIQSNWSHKLSLAYQDDELKTPAFGSRFDSERLSLDWINHFTLSPQQRLSAGLNYYDEKGTSRETFGNSTVYQGSRENLGLFSLWRGNLAANILEASLRYDDNSEFGGEWTGNLAWAYQLAGHTRVSASVGNAFRAPSLSEQQSPGFGGLFAGNPDLQPETSTSIEFGVRSTIDSPQWWSGSLYATNVDNLIAFEGADFQAININKAEIRGMEVSYGYASGPWSTRLDLTLQHTRNKATNASLLRRPDSKLGGNLGYSFDNGARIGAEAFYSSDRLDFGTNLGSYWLVNLNAQYPISNQWLLEARVENLLDEDYELAAGFNTPKLSGFLGIRWQAGR